MRSTAAKGIEFRSTDSPLRPWVDVRRPFSSTSVYCEPNPRNEAPVAPLLCGLLPVLLRKSPPWLVSSPLMPLPLALMLANSCSALLIPKLTKSSALMTWIGDAPSSWARLMLEPVISTRSSFFSAGAAVCALARVAKPAMPATPISAMHWAILLSFTVFSFS